MTFTDVPADEQPNATVEMLLDDALAAERTVTLANDAFEISGLKAGTYAVRIVAESYVLFEQSVTVGAAVEELGGTGRTHDWSVSAEFVRRSPRPVFLAGGLTPGNVADAIATRSHTRCLRAGVRSRPLFFAAATALPSI